MIEELDFELDAYDQTNHTRCFLHVVNLVAKSFLKPFKVKKKKGESQKDAEKGAIDLEIENIVGEAEWERQALPVRMIRTVGLMRWQS